MLRCHRGLAPPTLLFYLLILPSHLNSILSSLSPLYHALVSAVFCQSVCICSEAQIISLLVVLADLVLFSSPVGPALLFLHPSFPLYDSARLSALVFPCSYARLFTVSLPFHLCSHPALPLDFSGGCLSAPRRLGWSRSLFGTLWKWTTFWRLMPAGWFLVLSFCFRCLNKCLFSTCYWIPVSFLTCITVALASFAASHKWAPHF